MTKRQLIKIDDEKCDGCGQCAPACAEGAIRIIAGKARLISERYCDGLGACIGECPQGAITIEEREAEEFSAEAVERHLAKIAAGQAATETASRVEPDLHLPACPGAASRVIRQHKSPESAGSGLPPDAGPSALTNWPVQIRLVPAIAPYLQGARLLIAADCVPFAFADFHRRFLADRTLMVGCPKLDDADLYRRKLAQVFSQNDIESIAVVYMEVPCCFGLVHLVRQALEESGKSMPVTLTKIGIGGHICETSDLAAQAL